MFNEIHLYQRILEFCSTKEYLCHEQAYITDESKEKIYVGKATAKQWNSPDVTTNELWKVVSSIQMDTEGLKEVEDITFPKIPGNVRNMMSTFSLNVMKVSAKTLHTSPMKKRLTSKRLQPT